MRLLEAVEAINQAQPARLVALLTAQLPDLKGRPVTVLGLAFKQDTDDVRETPARPVVEHLLAAGAVVTVYDPIANGQVEGLFGKGRVRVADSLANAVANADAVILITRWAEFDALPDLLAARSPAPLLVDGRRMIEPDRVARYVGIGLGAH